MSEANVSTKECLRPVVVFFGVFMALMLFQTPYLNLGTITALASMILTALAFLLQKHNRGFVFRIGVPNLALLAFLLYSIAITIFNNYSVPSPERYVAQILLCFLMFSVTMNHRETKFLREVFILSSTVYAILTIYALITNPISDRIHMNIQLFNAEMDPNFIGLPFVSSLGLCLDSILKKDKRILHAVCFLILAITIVQTASRGSMLSSVVICGLVMLGFLFSRSVSMGKKIVWLVLILVGIILLLSIFSTVFAEQLLRMTTIDSENDGGRLKLWERALNAWSEAPLFGKGLDYSIVTFQKATHNTYLQILSETGLIGFSLFAIFLGYLFKKAYDAGIEYVFVLFAMCLQIMFLDALTSRVVWVVFCWFAMLPKKPKTSLNDMERGK